MIYASRKSINHSRLVMGAIDLFCFFFPNRSVYFGIFFVELTWPGVLVLHSISPFFFVKLSLFPSLDSSGTTSADRVWHVSLTHTWTK